LIWISGLLIYLNDKNFQKLMDNCKKMLKKNGLIIVRDGTAKKKRFVLNKKFSSELNALYSAHYRTIKEYKNIFSKNFKVIEDENMFPKNSILNKRKETILRIYKLKHYEKI
jgi:cyclopropane fatty-acyl-phospholipid synthase-like methyltransferase